MPLKCLRFDLVEPSLIQSLSARRATSKTVIKAVIIIIISLHYKFYIALASAA